MSKVYPLTGTGRGRWLSLLLRRCGPGGKGWPAWPVNPGTAPTRGSPPPGRFPFFFLNFPPNPPPPAARRIRRALLGDGPPSGGEGRWDALLAALAEHLAAKQDLAPPGWAELRVLGRPWFPAELRVQRADALVHAPAAFRKHGVYLAA